MRSAVLASLLAVLASTAGCHAPAAPFHGIDVTGASFGQALAIPDGSGHLRSLPDYQGQVVVVFFGYTHCPDVCPTTLATLAEAHKALTKAAVPMQVLFVTLDPERDSGEVVTAYPKAFDPSFVGLRGTAAQTQAVASAFKVFYQKVAASDAGQYTIDHTAQSFAYDTSGHLRLVLPPTESAAFVADDLQRLAKGG